MTRKRLAGFCLIGVTMWTLIIGGTRYAKSHSDFWFYLLMTVWGLIVVALLVWLWKAVDRQEAELEYEAAMRRENEQYDYDEYEAPQPPRAA